MNPGRRQLLETLGVTGVTALAGCGMLSDDGTDTDDTTPGDATDTVSPTDGSTDTQPAGATERPGTTVDPGDSVSQSPPEDVVNAVEAVDAGSEISLKSIYGEGNVTWNDGKAELEVNNMKDFFFYAIYNGTRSRKTFYDMNANERKMNISLAFINKGVVEGMLIPRAVERDDKQQTEITMLVDEDFMDFVDAPLRLAGGSGSVEEWAVIGKLNPEIVHDQNATVYGATAYLDVEPDAASGAIVGTFSESDLSQDSYPSNLQVAIEMSA